MTSGMLVYGVDRLTPTPPRDEKRNYFDDGISVFVYAE